MLYILTFQVLSRVSAKKKKICPGFVTFWDQFQAISRPGQIIFKSPGFPGFAGNPAMNIHDFFV